MSGLPGLRLIEQLRPPAGFGFLFIAIIVSNPCKLITGTECGYPPIYIFLKEIFLLEYCKPDLRAFKNSQSIEIL